MIESLKGSEHQLRAQWAERMLNVLGAIEMEDNPLCGFDCGEDVTAALLSMDYSKLEELCHSLDTELSRVFHVGEQLFAALRLPDYPDEPDGPDDGEENHAHNVVSL